LPAGVVLLLLAIAAPRLVRVYWSIRSSNSVRRGVRLAQDLSCFSCHGPSGAGGMPDPRATTGEVPAWSGGTWMMYVNSDEQIRQFILDGVSHARKDSAAAREEREKMAIGMPAYRDYLSDSDVEDLVAAFKVLSRMALPAVDTAERRGHDVAERWQCFACHGPAGSGGLPNPGSFAGFIPGWYGADFDDLVHDREEFDLWVREGTIPRLRDQAVASYFMRRQRIAMPTYDSLSAQEVDDLWAYAQWLAETDGGHRDVKKPW
jgi:mono/diheme cytochrome c family protein